MDNQTGSKMEEIKKYCAKGNNYITSIPLGLPWVLMAVLFASIIVTCIPNIFISEDPGVEIAKMLACIVVIAFMFMLGFKRLWDGFLENNHRFKQQWDAAASLGETDLLINDFTYGVHMYDDTVIFGKNYIIGQLPAIQPVYQLKRIQRRREIRVDSSGERRNSSPKQVYYLEADLDERSKAIWNKIHEWDELVSDEKYFIEGVRHDNKYVKLCRLRQLDDWSSFESFAREYYPNINISDTVRDTKKISSSTTSVGGR